MIERPHERGAWPPLFPQQYDTDRLAVPHRFTGKDRSAQSTATPIGNGTCRSGVGLSVVVYNLQLPLLLTAGLVQGEQKGYTHAVCAFQNAVSVFGTAMATKNEQSLRAVQ